MEPVNIEGLSEQHQALRDVIISKLPKDAEPVFISICGSMAKGMASPGSDFDMKLIVKYPKNAYVLKQVKGTHQLDTDLNGIEVEGAIMDMLVVLKYLVESNPMIYECFEGIPIYKTQVSEEIQKLWYEAYKWGKIHYAVAGMLGNYKKKQLYIEKNNKEIKNYKLAGDCV